MFCEAKCEFAEEAVLVLGLQRRGTLVLGVDVI